MAKQFQSMWRATHDRQLQKTPNDHDLRMIRSVLKSVVGPSRRFSNFSAEWKLLGAYVRHLPFGEVMLGVKSDMDKPGPVEQDNVFQSVQVCNSQVTCDMGSSSLCIYRAGFHAGSERREQGSGGSG